MRAIELMHVNTGNSTTQLFRRRKVLREALRVTVLAYAWAGVGYTRRQHQRYTDRLLFPAIIWENTDRLARL